MLGLIIAFLGLLTLVLGHGAGVQFFLTLGVPGAVDMKPLTAAMFITAGLLVGIMHRFKNALHSDTAVTGLMAMASVLFGGAVLGITGLVGVRLPGIHTTFSVATGVPSLGTLAAFLMVYWAGFSFLMRKSLTRIGRLIMATGIIACVGYVVYPMIPVLGEVMFYYAESLSAGMALPTALGFIALGYNITQIGDYDARAERN